MKQWQRERKKSHSNHNIITSELNEPDLKNSHLHSTREQMSPFYFKFQFRNVEYSSGRNKTLLCFRVDTPGGSTEPLKGYMEDEHATAHAEEAFFQQVIRFLYWACYIHSKLKIIPLYVALRILLVYFLQKYTQQRAVISRCCLIHLWNMTSRGMCHPARVSLAPTSWQQSFSSAKKSASAYSAPGSLIGNNPRKLRRSGPWRGPDAS